MNHRLVLFAVLCIHLACAPVAVNNRAAINDSACDERKIKASPEEQILSCSKEINKKPHAEWYLIRGLAYIEKDSRAKWGTGDGHQGLTDFQKAIYLDPKNVRAHIEEGKALRRFGRSSGAFLESFNTAIELDPVNVEAYVERGKAYAALRQPDRAASDFNKAIALDPGSAYAYTSLGEFYAKPFLLEKATKESSSYVKAMQQYNRAIEVDPSHIPVYLARSSLFWTARDYAACIEDLNKVEQLGGADIALYSKRGKAYMFLDQYHKAIEEFSAVIKLSPKNTMTLLDRIHAYERVGNFKGIIGDYTTLIEIHSNRTSQASADSFFIYRVEAYISDGQLDKALGDLKTVMQKMPDDLWALGLLARIYSIRGQYNLLIDTYTRMIELHPDNFEIYRKRAEAYKKTGQDKKAAADLAEAGRRERVSMEVFAQRLKQIRDGKSTVAGSSIPETLEECISLAAGHVDRGEHFEAITILNIAYDRYGDDARLRYQRGRAYSESFGRWYDTDAALADFAKAIELDPSFAWPYYGESRVYFMRYDYARATEAIGRAIELAPSVPVFHSQLGAILAQSSAGNEALNAYARAIELNPQESEYYFGRAETYRGMRRRALKSLAIKDYDKALELKPDHHGAKFYRALSLSSLGRIDEAIVGLEDAVAQSPNHDLSYYWLAKMYLIKGREEAAINAYSEAIEINPTQLISLEERGKLYLKAGQYEKAVADFDVYLEYFMPTSMVLAMRSEAISKLNPGKTPIEALSEAISKLNPGKTPMEALEEEEKVEPTWENYYEYYMLAIQSEDRAVLEKSARLLEDYLTIHAEVPNIFYMLATVYEKLGNEKKAAGALLAGRRNFEYYIYHYDTSSDYIKKQVDVLTKVIELKPKSSLKRFQRAEAYLILKNCRKASSDMEDAYRLIGNDYSKHPVMHVRILQLCGKHRKAVEILDKMLAAKAGIAKFNQQMSKSLYFRARSYFKMGRYSEALQDLKAAYDGQGFTRVQ